MKFTSTERKGNEKAFILLPWIKLKLFTMLLYYVCISFNDMRKATSHLLIQRLLFLYVHHCHQKLRLMEHRIMVELHVQIFHHHIWNEATSCDSSYSYIIGNFQNSKITHVSLEYYLKSFNPRTEMAEISSYSIFLKFLPLFSLEKTPRPSNIASVNGE